MDRFMEPVGQVEKATGRLAALAVAGLRDFGLAMRNRLRGVRSNPA